MLRKNLELFLAKIKENDIIKSIVYDICENNNDNTIIMS